MSSDLNPPVVSNQPSSSAGYSAVPSAPPPGPASPNGLEYLMQIDQLLVHQQVELVEALTGFETNNKYQVKNVMGQPVFFAAEENDCCTRNCCGSARPFKMNIVDNFGKPVMRLERPLRCQACCCCCCLQELRVFSPPETLIGIVKQTCSVFRPSFAICDANEEVLLKVYGPCLRCRCCADVKFEVFGLDGKTKVGRITKQWSGIANEALTDADNFSATFPTDMDVKVKATSSAIFLIDFMYYENNQKAKVKPRH